MQLLGIGEIARRAGVATSTIRYYERIGLLPPSNRVNTKRRYDTGILQKLSVIRMAQQAGLTIAEIQTLLHDFPVDTPPSERWQALAVTKIVELDELIKQLRAMKSLLEQTLQCHCSTIEECAKVEDNLHTDVRDIAHCADS
ncbi:MAG: MerR family transcriptional regulator [Chloroflexi bacterium]|nr:MerR family transcriptional regulator [Chloroflexota bacterium]